VILFHEAYTFDLHLFALYTALVMFLFYIKLLTRVSTEARSGSISCWRWQSATEAAVKLAKPELLVYSWRRGGAEWAWYIDA
jgi:hypothetical protein